MSWDVLEPHARNSAARAKQAIEFAVGKLPGKSGLDVVRLVIRPEYLPHGVRQMLQKGKPVSVMRGAGEHAGQLRVTTDGNFGVASAGGSGASTALVVILPAWPGLPANRRAPVTYRHADGALEIDLPLWAGGRGPSIAATAAVAPPSAAVAGVALAARSPIREAVAEPPRPALVPGKPKPAEGERFSMLDGRVPATRARP